MKFSSGVQDVLFKSDAEYLITHQHQLRFGIWATYHHFTPGSFKSKLISAQLKNTGSTQFKNKVLADEVNYYLEDQWDINDKFSVNAGGHGSIYFLKTNNYYSIQPRLLARYKLKPFTVKVTYSRMTQFIHLLSSMGAGLPMDLWVPSTNNIVPEIADQYSIGIVKTIKDKFEFSMEGYYKKMANLISLKPGTSFISGGNKWEGKVAKEGLGQAYGVEFLLQKKEGRTTGWIAYTWSKNKKKFEELNKDEWFPYQYDRTHDLSIVLNHQLSEGTSLSATWVYNTGTAVTLPSKDYILKPNRFSG